MLYQQASSADKEYKEYPGAYHQLLAELADVKEDLKARATAWINNRLTV